MFGLKNYYFLIPIIGMIPWTGMLITMLICWGLQGHPIYAFIGYEIDPVYISHIGATNLQPLFISCSAWQGIFYILTIFTEYRLRKSGKLQYWFQKSERNSMFFAVVFGAIGQAGIILCSCFNIKNFRKLHGIFLAIFILGVFVSMICIMFQYCKMGLNYRKIHVSHEYWNKFTISFYLKLAWVIVAIVCAGVFEGTDNNNVSGVFEWILAFSYTFLWLVFAWDFYPAAKKNYKNQPYIHDWNNRGFWLYDEHYGDTNDKRGESPVLSQGRDETLVGDQNVDATNVNREFTDGDLEQYPITTDRETYPIPQGQQVPVFNRAD